MFALKNISKLFSKVKPLKIRVLSTESPLKFSSQVDGSQWQVKSALDNVLASLVSCQVATLKDINRRQKILQIKSIKFNRVQSSYDLANYLKGGSSNKLNDIFVQAEVQTDGTQQDLDKLHKKVQNSCPVFQMISGSGVKITNLWKAVKKA